MTTPSNRRTAAVHRPFPGMLPVWAMIGLLLFAGLASSSGEEATNGHHHHEHDGCSSCGSSAPALPATIGSSSVVCTVYPVYALARELASGSGRLVHLLLPATLGCPHHYTLTPGDFDRLGKAGVVFANGLGFEPFLDRVTQNLPALPRFDCASGMPTIPSVEDPAAPNAHVFTTPDGLRAMAERLETGLKTQDPTQASLYARNRETLDRMLVKKSEELRTLAGKLASVPVVLTHDSLDYLAGTLGLKVVTHLAVGEGGETSAGALSTIVETIKREKPVAVLVEGSELPPIVQTLVRETGIKPLHLELLTGGPEQPTADFLSHHFDELMAKLSILSSPSPKQ